MLVQLQNVSFGYAGEELLKDVSWQINDGEKIGLVGPNGCGKSTLLEILAGDIEPENGTVTRLRSCRIGYLAQTEKIERGETLLDSLLTPFENVFALRRKMTAIEEALVRQPEDHELLMRYGEIQHEYERLGGYTLQIRIEELVRDLGFSSQDLKRPLRSFSGGEVGRVGLMKVLLQEPELVLLDEPTNHLDIETTEKLEARLATWRGAVVVVSHDRTFLNNVCTGIVEMVGERLECFNGDYDAYKNARVERMQALNAAILKQKARIDKLEDYIARNQAGQKARQARSKKKALNKIDKIEVPQDPWVRAEQLKLAFTVGERVGPKRVLKAEGLELGYGQDKQLISAFDLSVFRGEKIGIVGPNGCGKTTLLRALLGKDLPCAGRVDLGGDLTVGFFDQNRTDLTATNTLIDEIRGVRGELSPGAARNLLGALRFSGDDVFRPVGSLSGGEKNRLALGKLALRPVNLLALDEPTNHLDIPARQALENALQRYTGTLLVVSHDRYFLDRIVEKTIFVYPENRVEVVDGNYSEAKELLHHSDSLRQAPAEGRGEDAGVDRTLVSAADAKRERIAEHRERKKISRALEKARRDVQTLERRIAELEETLGAMDEKIAQSASDWTQLSALTQERKAVEAELEDRIQRWETRFRDAERFEAQLASL
jgi:ATP-binding cassette subfamily F protein 3